MRTRDEIIDDIEEYFSGNLDVLAIVLEELDGWNGCLDSDRWFTMDMLDDELYGLTPTEILERAHFGWDKDNWWDDSHGNREYGKFNPNRKYFRYDGYGNLVSANHKDYTDNIDSYTVEVMLEERGHLDSIDDDAELAALFDELEEAEKS